jgi:hypothetical protein
LSSNGIIDLPLWPPAKRRGTEEFIQIEQLLTSKGRIIGVSVVTFPGAAMERVKEGVWTEKVRAEGD